MPTTVLVSRHDLRLYLLPAASPDLDAEALRRVLGAHGLTLLEGSDLALANELVVAEDLEPGAAAALAEDLRQAGLVARVVNMGGLTMSRRIGNALAVQAMVAMAGLVPFATGLILLPEAVQQGIVAGTLGVWTALAVGVVCLIYAAVNALVLQRHGGAALRVAAVSANDRSPVPQLTSQLHALAEELPAELAAPLLARARTLAAHALRQPDGEAARELAALVEDLQRPIDAEVAEEARALREDVARARRAIQETRGR